MAGGIQGFPLWGKPWGAQIPSLPFQGRWLGEAETERSLQICDNLSVSLRLTAPLEGEPWMVRSVGAEGAASQALRASSPGRGAFLCALRIDRRARGPV